MIRCVACVFSLCSFWAVLGLFGAAALLSVHGRDLPDHGVLADHRPASLSRVFDGDRRLIDEQFEMRRIFTPIEDIPSLVRNAFISAEDGRFHAHPGVDAPGMGSALLDHLRGKRLRGASTITQQVAKTLLLSDERSVGRKVREIVLALRLERDLTKARILEIYLNEIYLGARTYGVAAAAQAYFGKPLEALTLAEAASLAALPKAPSELNPRRDRDAARARRAYVLNRMFRNGHVTRAQLDAALAAPLIEPAGDLALPRRTYFTAELGRRAMERLGRDRVLTGGLSFHATVDRRLQAAAGAALRLRLEAWDRERDGWRGPVATVPPSALGARQDWSAALSEIAVPRDVPGWRAAVVLQVENDGVRIGLPSEDADGADHVIPFREMAWARPRRENGGLGPAPRAASEVLSAGDVVIVTPVADEPAAAGAARSWSLRQIPLLQGALVAMEPATGRVVALQGGFSYEASAFNRATQALRQPGSTFKPFVYAAALDAGYTPSTPVLDGPIAVDVGGDAPWSPANASLRFHGSSPLRVGLERSRNAMTVRLAQALGMNRIASYAERFGLYDDMPLHPSYALGAGETTLLKMTAAYAMIANGGRRIEPTLTDRILDRRGVVIDAYEPPQASRGPTARLSSDRVLDPVTAFQLVSMMQGVVQRGTARDLRSLRFPVAGKTGTTNEAKDAWFVGFTPDLVVGCFIGYDAPRPMGRGASGASLCGPVFAAFMSEAMRDRRPRRFEAPRGVEIVKIDAATGARLPDDADGPDVVQEAYRHGDAPPLARTPSDNAIDGGYGRVVSDVDASPMTPESGAEQTTVPTSVRELLSDLTLSPAGSDVVSVRGLR